MQDEGNLDSSSLKAFQQVSNWMLLYAMFLQIKG